MPYHRLCIACHAVFKVSRAWLYRYFLWPRLRFDMGLNVYVFPYHIGFLGEAISNSCPTRVIAINE
jgi:hypothetical protein